MPIEFVALLSIISATVAGISLSVSLRTRAYDHTRSKRKNTIELMQFLHMEFKDDAMKRRSLTILFSSLDHQQCENIWFRREVKISNNNQENINVLLPGKNHQTNDGYIVLSANEVGMIRSDALAILNILEIIAAAYVSDLCEPDLFKAEFGPIFYPSGSRLMLQNFIEATPIYPSIKKLHKSLGSSSDIKDFKSLPG